MKKSNNEKNNHKGNTQPTTSQARNAQNKCSTRNATVRPQRFVFCFFSFFLLSLFALLFLSSLSSLLSRNLHWARALVLGQVPFLKKRSKTWKNCKKNCENWFWKNFVPAEPSLTGQFHTVRYGAETSGIDSDCRDLSIPQGFSFWGLISKKLCPTRVNSSKCTEIYGKIENSWEKIQKKIHFGCIAK